MSAKPVSEIELTRALVKLEEDILRVHDMAPADANIDEQLGFALMHVRKARGSRVLPPNPYTKKK